MENIFKGYKSDDYFEIEFEVKTEKNYNVRLSWYKGYEARINAEAYFAKARIEAKKLLLKEFVNQIIIRVRHHENGGFKPVYYKRWKMTNNEEED